MASPRTHDARKEMSSLEAAAASARAGFACIFSTSDEYEKALISERRAQGRYGSHIDWQLVLLAGCAFLLSGIVLVML